MGSKNINDMDSNNMKLKKGLVTQKRLKIRIFSLILCHFLGL